MASTLDIRVEGMTCAHCARSVEKQLCALPGVAGAEADFASGSVRLRVQTPPLRAELAAAVNRAGYRLRDDAAAPDAADEARAQARNHLHMLVLGAALTAPVMAMDFLHWHGRLPELLLLGLALLLQATVGYTFYRGAVAGIRSRNLGMDVLVSIGMAAGLGYGALLVLLDWPLPEGLSRHVFFEAATLLVVFLRLGKYVEAKARGNALSALRSLLSLAPPVARIMRGDAVVEIPARDVAVGDVCVVLAGDRIPVDGEVAGGEADVDESMLTGEPLPVARALGSHVRAGTIATNGRLELRAVAVGAQTTLAAIVRLVQQAQLNKAPIQRFADRVSNVFVPVVVAVALVAFAGWLSAGAGAARAITHGIAVLVIACPCALGIAVPAAVMIGSAEALRRGVLVKSGAALEQIARARVFAFDKTGTLTAGKPRLAELRLAAGADEATVRAALATVAASSRHPLARAAAAPGAAPAARCFEFAGKGLVALHEGRTLLFGSAALLSEQKASLPAELAARADELRNRALSVSLLAVDGAAVAALGFEDPVAPGAADVVSALKTAGVEVAMVSGDHELAARRVAEALGITRVHAGLTPAGKLAALDELSRLGPVAMVGDGINDAPALARATVGVAVGQGSDVAKETGDLVLMSGRLGDLLIALQIGRRSLRAIRQNLFLSLVYNAIGVPLAAGALVWAGVFLPPSFAALSMVLSDLSIAVNSARLAAELRRTSLKFPGA
ncbi:MAG: cation-translocating P-type ATPase [Planctomycetes bacterium]|nr:cation-translocating P-type ATPase [Planctomycetota bacterium]